MLTSIEAEAQFTITGLKGMVSVPHAEVLDDRTFMIGMHTNDFSYFLNRDSNRPLNENEKVYSLNIAFLKKLNVILNLTRVNNSGDTLGIGDRDAQITYLIFEEKDRLPSIVVNFGVPDTDGEQFLAGNHLVMSKCLAITSELSVKNSLGYGVPFVFGGFSRDGFLQEKKSEFLTGLFGGLELIYLEKSRLSLEYDGRAINAGLTHVFFKKISLELFLQGVSQFGFGVNYMGGIN